MNCKFNGLLIKTKFKNDDGKTYKNKCIGNDTKGAARRSSNYTSGKQKVRSMER